jgi:hypothetical protein
MTQWKTIDSQSDLDTLNNAICWDDSSSVEYYATNVHESYFPSEINRSGYSHKNIHILCYLCGGPTKYLEIVCIHCDHCSFHFLDNPFLNGRVDALKRIEIFDYRNDIHLRCARLIYRFLSELDVSFLSDQHPEGLFIKGSVDDNQL